MPSISRKREGVALRVVLSAGAEDDLEALHDYVALYRSPDEASALLDALVDRCEVLTSFPLRGSIPIKLADLGLDDFRQILSGPHRIVYFIDGEAVVVVLIADSRRDMRALLQRRLLRS